MCYYGKTLQSYLIINIITAKCYIIITIIFFARPFVILMGYLIAFINPFYQFDNFF